MITKNEYEKALFIVEQYLLQFQNERLDEETTLWYKHYSKFLGISKEDDIFKYASTKLMNSLIYNRDNLKLNIKNTMSALNYYLPIEELSKLSLSEFKKSKNVGPKTVWELKAICYYAQVRLKN